MPGRKALPGKPAAGFAAKGSGFSGEDSPRVLGLLKIRRGRRIS
jgi:hypothetical protein